MKVGINNKPLPLPLGDAATGGLLSGAGAVLGSAIDAIAGAFNAKKQRQHDKDMAALNQQNALEQMSVQNQYQFDQWNRENAYNDPSAVAERYRAAGINPRAAFGQGSAGGAGIAGGLSSAPSGSNTGSASNIMFGTSFAGGLSHIGSAYLEGRRTDAEVAHKNAETAEQLIENEYKEQSLVADLLIKRGEYEKLVADKSLSEQQKEHYIKLIKSTDQQIKESQERTKGYAVQRDSLKAQTENTKASTYQITEDTRTAKQNNDLFEQTGVRPGMNAEQALISIGSKLFDLKQSDISGFLKKFGVVPDSTVTQKQVENASQILADEYNRLEDKNFKNNDKDAYYRYKMRLWHNLALSFK